MIVTMRRVTLIAEASRRDRLVAELRKLGALHVRHVRDPASDGIQELEARLDEVGRALDALAWQDTPRSEADVVVQGAQAPITAADPDRDVQEILAIVAERETLAAERDILEEKLVWFQDWGDASVAAVEGLREAGLFVRCYVVDRGILDALPEQHHVEIVKAERHKAWIVLVGTSPDEALAVPEALMPDIDASHIRSRLAQIESRVAHADVRLGWLRQQRPSLEAQRRDLAKRLELAQVVAGAGVAEELAYVQGYCPVDRVEQLVATARQQSWAYLIEVPDDVDDVPTLVRVPRWLRIVDPVFRFMGTTPGYQEYDTSFWFLASLSLFFAMLIGDGGYGVLFLLLTFAVSRRVPGAPAQLVTLSYVLSVATIAWGAVAGTWFGHEALGRLPALSWMTVERLNSFSDASPPFLMRLCFLIGAAHLSIARLLAALRRAPSLTAIGELGWIAILWTLYFVAGNLVLGSLVPAYTQALFGLGAAAVLLFTNLQHGVLRGALRTLADLPLKVISSFSDVVSYIRLFAVGYATVVVASSFNDMALRIGFDAPIAAVCAVLVLVLGHGVNILLGLMAVIVHGIRLNMLEFSGHLGMQWSGRVYEPFRE